MSSDKLPIQPDFVLYADPNSYRIPCILKYGNMLENKIASKPRNFVIVRSNKCTTILWYLTATFANKLVDDDQFA